ncbi:transketolase [Dethiosulfatibacter aminovorans DSM 17477]|uniref:Transketolase n=1 Tax=Dethiosulfatibacter aminovorans DSM 17477 TaxID=1121476 RepID=A0A1M6E8P3_9FIRM|nr:transketolase C-terminal domain-containing protein [Dethiosulfatibacter aminovorans]SHI81658.1 transketolase [Dethiosulfatibacter aminovorans DSM 17477]
MRDRFIKTLVEIAKRDKNVYLVTGEVGFGVLRPFWEQFPDRLINAGIAEQNLTSLAAGMALEGKIVFTYSIGNFPTMRCLEQIRNDCAYHKANVKIVSVGGGLAYGSLGVSHHATEDLAIMRALPHVTVMAPGDLTEVEYVTRAIYGHEGTCYMRIGRGHDKQLHDSIDDFKIGKAIKIKDGEKTAIFSTGAIFDEALEACRILEYHGVNPSLYTFPTVKPIDRETIEACACNCDWIVTLEEHNIIGGFGGAVSEVLAEMGGVRAKLMKIGLNDEYSSVVGNHKYLREAYGLSAEKIAQRIEGVLGLEVVKMKEFKR